jgi:hypothetical protein
LVRRPGRDLVHGSADALIPVYQELLRQAAQGEIVHNDDTGMKILELGKALRLAAEEAKPGEGK